MEIELEDYMATKKVKKEYKRLPKNAQSHWEWRGTGFVQVFTIKGNRYVKYYTPDNVSATLTNNNN